MLFPLDEPPKPPLPLEPPKLELPKLEPLEPPKLELPELEPLELEPLLPKKVMGNYSIKNYANH